MLKLETRSFILSHGDPSGDQCEDFLAYDDQKHRYAVADGVSNSFRPDFVSEYLAKRFVEDDGPADTWAENFQSAAAEALSKDWHSRVDEFLTKYTGFALEIRQKRLEDKGSGGSTFCGIEIDPQSASVSYAVIGDSCLYYVPADGRIQILTCGVMDPDDNGVVPVVHFNNVTDCILVDVPETAAEEKWKKGAFEVSDGFLALMTDGAAHWFMDKLTESPDTSVENLWLMLENPEEMTQFVMTERQGVTPLSDDIAIIMVKLSQAEPQIDEPEAEIQQFTIETEEMPAIVPVDEDIVLESEDTEIVVAPEEDRPAEVEPDDEPAAEEPAVDELTVDEPTVDEQPSEVESADMPMPEADVPAEDIKEPEEEIPPIFQPVEYIPPCFQLVEHIPPRIQQVEDMPPMFQPVEEFPPMFQSIEETPPKFQPVEEFPPSFQPVEEIPPIFQPVEETPPRFQPVEEIPPRFQAVEETPPRFRSAEEISSRFELQEIRSASSCRPEDFELRMAQLKVRRTSSTVLFFRELLSKIKSLCQSLSRSSMKLFF